MKDGAGEGGPEQKAPGTQGLDPEAPTERQQSEDFSWRQRGQVFILPVTPTCEQKTGSHWEGLACKSPRER